MWKHNTWTFDTYRFTRIKIVTKMIVREGNFRKPYTVTSLCLQLILTTAADDKGGIPLSDTMTIKVILSVWTNLSRELIVMLPVAGSMINLVEYWEFSTKEKRFRTAFLRWMIYGYENKI